MLPSPWAAEGKHLWGLLPNSQANGASGFNQPHCGEEGAGRRERGAKGMKNRWCPALELSENANLVSQGWPDKEKRQSRTSTVYPRVNWHFSYFSPSLTWQMPNLSYWVETGWWVLAIEGENFWCFSLMTWLIFFQRPFTLGSGEGWLTAPRCALTPDTRPLWGWKPMTAET